MITIGANRLWVRKLRLITGLTLFTYVTTHLLNHSLGNISIPAMEAGMVVQKWIWQGVVGTAGAVLRAVDPLPAGAVGAL